MGYTIKEYQSDSGRIPFRDWLNKLDPSMRARIQARIFRFESGNLGDHKNLGGGIWEARLDFGPGYRLYFGKDGSAIVLLLLGGNKQSQSSDMRRARIFWSDYLEDNHG